MSEPPEAPDPPSSDGHSSLFRLPFRLAPWLALAAAAAAFWRRRRRPGQKPLTPEEIDAAEPHRGRLADYPWEIPPRGWKDILWRTYHEYGRARLPALAGGVTFYLLLASFPAVAAFVSLYGMFFDVDSVEKHFLHLATIFPSDAVNLIGAQMVRVAGERHGALGAAFAVSAVVSMWSANAGMKALFDGVNVAYNETEKRPYLKRTLLTYGATLAAVVFTVSITAVALAAPLAFHDLGLHHLADVWKPLRWGVMLAMTTTGFALVYRFGPSRAPARWRWLICGALFAAVSWMTGSLGFSWYLNTFTHVGVTYGSLGAIIGFMLWVWLSVMIVLLGAELNSEIEHQTALDTTAGAPTPVGQRGAVVADSLGRAFPMSPREMRNWTGAMLAREARGVWKGLRGR